MANLQPNIDNFIHTFQHFGADVKASQKPCKVKQRGVHDNRTLSAKKLISPERSKVQDHDVFETVTFLFLLLLPVCSSLCYFAVSNCTSFCFNCNVFCNIYPQLKRNIRPCVSKY